MAPLIQGLVRAGTLDLEYESGERETSVNPWLARRVPAAGAVTVLEQLRREIRRLARRPEGPPDYRRLSPWEVPASK